MSDSSDLSSPEAPGAHALRTGDPGTDPAGTPIFPTGAQYEISAGNYHAVVTELGATLRQLQINGRDLIRGFTADGTISSGRGQQLMPWPNRIRDGKYSFAGTEYQLPLSEPELGNAIHGLVRWSGWRLITHEPSSVTQQLTVYPQKGWGSVLECTISHRLSTAGLEVEVEARNVGALAVPFGYAAHPFLTCGESDVDELTLELPADRYLQVDDRLLPVALVDVDADHDFRSGRLAAGVDLDTAFTGLHREADGRWQASISTGSRRTTLWGDERHTWMQVYTGAADRTTGLAVEPMTCGPDAFNPGPTHDDVIVLEPGERYDGHWGIHGE